MHPWIVTFDDDDDDRDAELELWPEADEPAPDEGD